MDGTVYYLTVFINIPALRSGQLSSQIYCCLSVGRRLAANDAGIDVLVVAPDRPEDRA